MSPASLTPHLVLPFSVLVYCSGSVVRFSVFFASSFFVIRQLLSFSFADARLTTGLADSH